MKRVRILTHMPGKFNAGQIVSLPDAEAKGLIERGDAEDKALPPEKATANPEGAETR